MFPISRDPPEGGTIVAEKRMNQFTFSRFQFLGIPPKGEPDRIILVYEEEEEFPISRDPPEGGTSVVIGR